MANKVARPNTILSDLLETLLLKSIMVIKRQIVKIPNQMPSLTLDLFIVEIKNAPNFKYFISTEILVCG
jgi:hypothetical protein